MNHHGGRCFVALEHRAHLLRLWHEEMADGGVIPGIYFQENEALDDGEFDAIRERIVAERHVTTLRAAAPFWVSGDISAVVEAASKSLPDSPLQTTDLLEPCGLAVFDQPHRRLEVLTWYLVGERVHLAAYSRENGRWMISECRPWMIGSTLTLAAEEVANGVEDGLVALFDDEGRHRVTEASDVDEYDDLRFIRAFWLICQQRLAVRSSTRVDRASRRRLERMKAPPQQEVNVITLRRTRSTETTDESRDVEWTHRWIVGGHWRNQFLPATNTHRMQWISPYVKGPEHLPLVPKERVFRVVR